MRLAAILVVLCALGAPVVAQGVSPGPLAKGHASLEGVDACIKCHSGGDAISASRCLGCHQALDARITAKAGYHASVGTDCASCHPDHRGVSAALVKWPGGDRDRFDHKLAGYELLGTHATTKCRDCHKPAFQTGPVAKALTGEERPVTYLALGTTCATCHVDTHKPSLGTDCQRCHDTKSWQAGGTSSAFDHAKTRYPLAGAHQKVECTKCHGGTTKKLKDLKPAFDTCKTCHEDPHGGVMGTKATACASCHTVTAWKDLVYDRATHSKTLPLVGAHAKLACAGCHGEKVVKKPAPACLGCHPEVHKPSLGTQCGACHSVMAWTQSTKPQLAFHDRTRYPLRGRHADLACKECHDPKKPMAKRYRPLPFGSCLDCHADEHGGQASKPCETCHSVERWTPPRFELADHAKTRFALDGAHRATPCGKCHPSSPALPKFNLGSPPCETCHADPHAAQFGTRTCASCHATTAWAPSTYDKVAHAKTHLALEGKHDVACGRCHAKKFAGLPTECGTCHDDRHAGQFPGRACTECHAGAEFKPAKPFDHSKSFPLRGRHATAECIRCHPRVSVAVTATVSLDTEVYHLGKRSHECTGCHRAQHGDALSSREQPRKLAAVTHACETCHTEASWRALAAVPFDHTTTGAPLTGAHATAPCASCHQPAKRPIPRLAACATCHADHHAGRLGERCEACHSPTSWKQDQLLVDHQRTRLPLVGAHAVQGCPTCHVQAQAGTYRGLDPTCRGCHLHTVEDRRPHPDHTRDLAFLSCQDCHTALGWRPASVNHDRFWPLTGKHASTPCSSRCHLPGAAFSAAPRECLGCHQAELARAQPDHSLFPTQCGECHSTTSWIGTSVNHPQFALTNRHNVECKICHTTPAVFADFSCTSGACHPQAKTDSRHRGRGGYSYDSTACYRCHRNSGGGG